MHRARLYPSFPIVDRIARRARWPNRSAARRDEMPYQAREPLALAQLAGGERAAVRHGGDDQLARVDPQLQLLLGPYPGDTGVPHAVQAPEPGPQCLLGRLRHAARGRLYLR